MTSNLGSDLIQNFSDDEDYSLMQSAVMEVVGNHFRPEVINRIDEVVVFHSLRKEQIRGIAEIQLNRLRKRLTERELRLSLTSTAMDKLVDVGFEPVYGARPLKRAIQQWIENPLAQELLAGKYSSGEEIGVDIEAGEFTFR
jgi:ATP-dependent Clp protease ATP-binding subunit ClpB